MKSIMPWLSIMLFCQPLTALATDDLSRETYARIVSLDGNIQLPPDFRQHWSHLGSWLVAEPDAPGHGFHDVYSQPETIAAFRRTGRFPDGAVLVKEIRNLMSGNLTTGRAQWAGQPSVWFVMVKDAKNRFPKHPNWGEGWGWALFKADRPNVNVARDFRQDCLNCHLPAKAGDWVYLEGYPSLQRPINK